MVCFTQVLMAVLMHNTYRINAGINMINGKFDEICCYKDKPLHQSMCCIVLKELGKYL